MRRLGIVAVGFALVVGILVGSLLGNPFDGKASASTAAVGGRLISLGTLTWDPSVSAWTSPMVDVSDCLSMKLMARAPQSETSDLHADWFLTSPEGAARIPIGFGEYALQDISNIPIDGFHTYIGAVLWVPLPYAQFFLTADPGATVTAWVWCATSSEAYAVGGFAELPALAGTGGSGMGGATYAVLAGAAAGVLAFAVLATLSVKRRGVG
jgi:hypothetical protein